MSISTQLQAAIRNAGESVYAVSKGSGVPQSVLSRFVNGERGLSLESVDRLAEYLELELQPKRASPRKPAKRTKQP
jgi:hypothetical protein